MDPAIAPRKLWEHPNPKGTEMYRFMQEVNEKHNLQLDSFWELYEYSITKRTHFWDQCFHFVNLLYSGNYTRIVDESARIDTVPRWFEGVHMNFAENLLYSREPSSPSSEHSTKGKEDNKVALTEVREGATEIRDVSWGKLRQDVGILAAAMKEHGVRKGDRIVVVASNSVDTLMVFLAVTWLGGLFSSSSTDMGVNGVLQRSLQVTPKYIFMDDFAVYNGKKVDLRQKMTEIVEGMKDSPGFEGVVSMPRFSTPVDISSVPTAQTLLDFLSKSKSYSTPEFEQVAFHDPFLIAYSSGTTGTPKCIVHSVGGAILSAAKEQKLHGELTSSDVALQYTTTGWIMYFVNVMFLLPGCRVVLYDGSPFQPDLTTFVKLIGEQKVTKFGTSPKWMGELAKNGLSPREVTDLGSLRVVSSTGMVLSDGLFEWFYNQGFPAHTQLANISGGTDLAGCFGMENPLTPVYVGGTCGPALGTPISILSPESPSTAPLVHVDHGEAGELVAPHSFPNQPVFFWNDTHHPPHPSSKYHSAYFEKYQHVWTHGDFVSFHPITKQLFFLGRADGVLNPSGVRFGSAEIYSVVLESGLFPEVQDAVVVGQRRPQDEDERVMLFLVMAQGKTFTNELVGKVKAEIGRALSKRHVPAFVFEVPEVPTTVNLKKVELPVKQIVSGKIIKPSGTLLNPKSLDYYYRFAKVEELFDPKSKL
ncbi:acetoacetate-CoA ligase [Tricladium varicosporioides]|nr:acetoacetate-CoA ligase [Hymenoscyphus varicosporioides]